jgi:tocopherol cyclase
MIRFSFFALCLCCLSSAAQELIEPVQFSEHQSIPFYGRKKRKNTSMFQGNKEKKNYFEGWYFKMVGDNGEVILSVIPGISLSEDGSEQHAFIQFINGRTEETHYVTYPITSFYFSRKEFAIKIENNYFSDDLISLNIQEDDLKINGQVKMEGITPYTHKKKSPAIMGWYRFVPFMECYHGVVSLTHQLTGKIQMNEKVMDFDRGKGYIEKDWGESMPESWIWMQSNHFSNTKSSFMLSVANIPWLGKSFTGFLGFYYFNGEVYRFATYTKAQLELKKTSENQLSITISDKKNRFVIETKNNHAGMLKAPVKGAMDRRIAESIDAEIKISLYDKNGQLLSKDSTQIAGLEMVGDISSLFGRIK